MFPFLPMKNLSSLEKEKALACPRSPEPFLPKPCSPSIVLLVSSTVYYLFCSFSILVLEVFHRIQQEGVYFSDPEIFL